MECNKKKRVSLFIEHLFRACIEEQNIKKVQNVLDKDIIWIGPGDDVGQGQNQTEEMLRRWEKTSQESMEITLHEYQMREISDKMTAFCGAVNFCGCKKGINHRIRYSGLCQTRNEKLSLYHLHITEVLLRESKDVHEVFLKREHYDELLESAMRDSLTGLYNKRETENLAERCIKQASENQYCAMLILDLDDFKKINDTFGHMAGDNVLGEIGKILKSTFRRDDVVGRIGGDEFAIIMPGFQSKNQIVELLDRLINMLEQSFQQCAMGISCSTGIAVAPMEGTSYKQLYCKADKALYRAKEKGKNQYCFHLAMPE